MSTWHTLSTHRPAPQRGSGGPAHFASLSHAVPAVPGAQLNQPSWHSLQGRQARKQSGAVSSGSQHSVWPSWTQVHTPSAHSVPGAYWVSDSQSAVDSQLPPRWLGRSHEEIATTMRNMEPT